MLSSHVRRSSLLWLHNKSRFSQQKVKWFGISLVHWCLNNRTLHGCLVIRYFSSRVEKYFTRSLRSLGKYFSTLEEKFPISARPCNILYIFYSLRLKLFSEDRLHLTISRTSKVSKYFVKHSLFVTAQ